MKRQVIFWEITFVKHIYKGLVPRVYKYLHNSGIKKTTQFKHVNTTSQAKEASTKKDPESIVLWEEHKSDAC